MHIVSVQLEIEDGQVFAAMFWVRRTRDGDDSTLMVPAQNSLRDSFAMLFANLF